MDGGEPARSDGKSDQRSPASTDISCSETRAESRPEKKGRLEAVEMAACGREYVPRPA